MKPIVVFLFFLPNLAGFSQTKDSISSDHQPSYERRIGLNISVLSGLLTNGNMNTYLPFSMLKSTSPFLNKAHLPYDNASSFYDAYANNTSGIMFAPSFRFCKLKHHVFLRFAGVFNLLNGYYNINPSLSHVVYNYQSSLPVGWSLTNSGPLAPFGTGEHFDFLGYSVSVGVEKRYYFSKYVSCFGGTDLVFQKGQFNESNRIQLAYTGSADSLQNSIVNTLLNSVQQNITMYGVSAFVGLDVHLSKRIVLSSQIQFTAAYVQSIITESGYDIIPSPPSRDLSFVSPLSSIKVYEYQSKLLHAWNAGYSSLFQNITLSIAF